MSPHRSLVTPLSVSSNTGDFIRCLDNHSYFCVVQAIFKSFFSFLRLFVVDIFETHDLNFYFNFASPLRDTICLVLCKKLSSQLRYVRPTKFTYLFLHYTPFTPKLKHATKLFCATRFESAFFIKFLNLSR